MFKQTGSNGGRKNSMMRSLSTVQICSDILDWCFDDQSSPVEEMPSLCPTMEVKTKKKRNNSEGNINNRKQCDKEERTTTCNEVESVDEGERSDEKKNMGHRPKVRQPHKRSSSLESFALDFREMRKAADKKKKKKKDKMRTKKDKEKREELTKTQEIEQLQLCNELPVADASREEEEFMDEKSKQNKEKQCYSPSSEPHRKIRSFNDFKCLREEERMREHLEERQDNNRGGGRGGGGEDEESPPLLSSLFAGKPRSSLIGARGRASNEAALAILPLATATAVNHACPSLSE